MSKKIWNKSTRFCVMAVTVVVFSSSVFALDLDSARNSGMIGERSDGYVASVSASASASSEVQSLVASVNAARKAEYARVATKNGQAVEVVEKLAAAKILEKAPAGNMFQDGSGNWVKK